MAKQPESAQQPETTDQRLDEPAGPAPSGPRETPLDPGGDFSRVPADVKRLAEEIRQDEHAARVRDYGEADAATYEQRIREGAATARHLDPVATARDDWMATLSIDDESRKQLAVELERIRRDTYVELEEQVAGWNYQRGAGGLPFHALPVSDREVLIEDYVNWGKYMERGLTLADQASVMYEAAREPFKDEETMRSQHGYTVLYRVEPMANGADMPEWVKQRQDELGITEARGRWFVADPMLLDWYRDDAAGETRAVFVEVPTADLESYRVANSIEQIGHRPVKSYSRDPQNEFFLPAELARRAAPRLYDDGELRMTERERAAADEPPLERAERQLRDWKRNNSPELTPDPATGRIGQGTFRPAQDASSSADEAGKLFVLETEIDWSGVSGRDKQAVLAREVDFSRITRDDLNGIFTDIGRDEVDERPARRLFDQANYARAAAVADQIPFDEQLAKARDTTRNLVESVMLDGWPRSGAIVDFGIDSQKHYESLYYPIRSAEIAPVVLDAAMGHGEKLTELVRGAPSNPHKGITFHTSWDELLGRDGGDHDTPAKGQPQRPGGGMQQPSQYQRTLDATAESGRQAGKDKSRGPER